MGNEQKPGKKAVVAFGVVESKRALPAIPVETTKDGARLSRELGLRLAGARLEPLEVEHLGSLLGELSADERAALHGLEIARTRRMPPGAMAGYVSDPRQAKLEIFEGALSDPDGREQIRAALVEAVEDRPRIDAIRARTAANLELDEAAELVRLGRADGIAEARYREALRAADDADRAFEAATYSSLIPSP
ncbi:MAG: hypothetical protein U1E65_00225 [Myxococcota bacterium]